MDDEYEKLFHYRDEEIDGIKKWLWLTTDNGAWIGPRDNWIRDHKDNILKHCKKFNTVISAGGNQGMYPRLLSEMFKWVYTFEPDPWNFFALVNNCQKDNIIKIQAALGASNQMGEILRMTMDNTGMHKIDDKTQGGNLPILKIDDFHFQSLDLIHIDVEGYEDNVLFGAQRNIEQHKPLIMAERGDRPNIKEFLAKFGYSKIGQSSADTIFSIDKPI